MIELESVKKGYNKLASKYSKLYFNRIDYPEFLEYFSSLIKKNGKILDAGCGPGQYSKYFADKSFDVIGIDISSKMIEIAKKKCKNAIFYKMNMEKLDFPDNSFDTVFSMFSFLHIKKDRSDKVLNEFYRVLKNNGYLFITVAKGREEGIKTDTLDKSVKIYSVGYEKEEFENKLKKKKRFQILKSKIVHYKDDYFDEDQILIIAKK